MPEIGDLSRLWEAWINAGLSNGNRPLSWLEIAAFSTVCDLSRDDRLILRAMSENYIDGLSMVSPLAKTPIEIDAERRKVD
jgi:hypothetical protein